jgi:hypothetical protein
MEQPTTMWAQSIVYNTFEHRNIEIEGSESRSGSPMILRFPELP